MEHGGDPASVLDDGVAVRTVVVGGLPLLVAVVGETGRGPMLRDALCERGLLPLAGFLGVELPRGARVGFVLDTDELRLVDDRDDTLLRAVRSGVDEAWLEAARRLRGTMAVLVRGAPTVQGDPVADVEVARLAAEIDRRARDGDAWGAIVGVADQRPVLPLMF